MVARSRSKEGEGTRSRGGQIRSEGRRLRGGKRGEDRNLLERKMRGVQNLRGGMKAGGTSCQERRTVEGPRLLGGKKAGDDQSRQPGERRKGGLSHQGERRTDGPTPQGGKNQDVQTLPDMRSQGMRDEKSQGETIEDRRMRPREDPSSLVKRLTGT